MRTISKLTALQVSKLKEPGYYADGAGLYLQVSSSGTKSWIFRYMLNGRAREMGLGPLHTINLSEARVHATECRKLKLAGLDPIEARKDERAKLQEQATNSKTFQQCCVAYIASHKAGWKSEKHADQWSSTLTAYAYPKLKNRYIHTISTNDIIDVLEPIWKSKTETASRVRGRMEAILDWAKVKGYRTGENPARWRGHLDNLLPKRSKVQKVQHHAALSYGEMPTFYKQLKAENTQSALALQFLILTATRTSETIVASWKEVNLKETLWVVPADRIKGGKEHRIPLSKPAISILESIKKAQKRGGIEAAEYVFSNGRVDGHISNMTMLQLLNRLGRDDLTVHGFRSTFRDWAAEKTHYPREVAEMALAHVVGDKVEAAYRRGDLFEKRAVLMADWAEYCLSGGK